MLKTSKKEIIFKLVFFVAFIFVASYAAYLNSIPREAHSAAGHTLMTLKWSENMQSLKTAALILSVAILFINFSKKGVAIAILSGWVSLTAVSVINKSHINIPDILLTGGPGKFYLDRVQSKQMAALPNRSFTMSSGEAKSRAFANTINEALPKIQKVTYKTMNYVKNKAIEASVDPRFSWYFSGRVPSPEAMKSLNSYFSPDNK